MLPCPGSGECTSSKTKSQSVQKPTFHRLREAVLVCHAFFFSPRFLPLQVYLKPLWWEGDDMNFFLQIVRNHRLTKGLKRCISTPDRGFIGTQCDWYSKQLSDGYQVPVDII